MVRLDMDTLLDALRIDGERLSLPVRANVAGGELLLSMVGASQLTLQIDDPDDLILSSGLLTRPRRGQITKGLGKAPWERLGKVTLTIPSVLQDERVPRGLRDARFRITGVERRGDLLTFTFEDEIVALLRQHKRRVKASRADSTRAAFIRRLTRAVRERQVLTLIYSEDKVQPLSDDAPEDVKATKRGIRLDAVIDLRGRPADRDQIRNMNLVLQAADEAGAGERATLALIEACIVEAPDFRNPVGGDGTSSGILQLTNIHLGGSTSTSGGRRDVKLVSKLFLTEGFAKEGKLLGGAMAAARKRPDWSPGRIAQAMQGSAFPDRYDLYQADAERILEAWGGAGRVVTQRRSYQFEVLEDEDYWDTTQRLAEEVRWRAFTTNNAFVYASDEDLLRAQPQLLVCAREKHIPRGRWAMVTPIDFDWHYNQPVGEATFSVPLAPYSLPAGSVVEIAGPPPLAGRWLTKDVRHPLDGGDAEVVVMRPAPAKPEPQIDPIEVTAADPEAGGDARERIVAAARKALSQAPKYSYWQIRPMPPSLFGPAPRKLDCASFVTLVYKYAGIVDPNRSDYNGSGYTGTLWRSGTKTNTPQPGDMCFWGIDPTRPGGDSHVAIYIGKKDGVAMAIGFGSNPVKEHRVDYAIGLPFAGYKTFSLERR